MTTARRLLGMLLASVLVLTAACGGDDDAASDDQSGDDTTEQGATLRVPEDHDTLQAAVDAAAPGDLILVGPGTYEEAVTVETDELTIRGLDRNEVILDGGFELDNGIRVVGANGVAIENMTARNYTNNGFFWTGVEGYRGSYLTTYRIGDYGVYAFESTQGLLEHSYASGSPDAGFYIGGCYPCDAVIDDVVAEINGLGYSGTNSGGNLLIVNSTFRDNRAGIVPNSGTYEPCYPERETTIVGNIVHSNNNTETPAIDVAFDAQGMENCFADNEHATSAPADLETLAPCEGEGSGDWATGALDFAPFLAEKPPSQDYKTTPVPAANGPPTRPSSACRRQNPARRAGCPSSSSSAGSVTRRPTTPSSIRGTAGARTSTCSSATRPPTPTRRSTTWRRATPPATSDSTWRPTGHRRCSTIARWSSRSRRSPTTGRASAWIPPRWSPIPMGSRCWAATRRPRSPSRSTSSPGRAAPGRCGWSRR